MLPLSRYKIGVLILIGRHCTIGEDHHQSNLGTVGGVTVFAQSILTNGVFIDPSSDTGPLSSFGAFCLTMQIDRRYQSCHGAFILY